MTDIQRCAGFWLLQPCDSLSLRDCHCFQGCQDGKNINSRRQREEDLRSSSWNEPPHSIYLSHISRPEVPWDCGPCGERKRRKKRRQVFRHWRSSLDRVYPDEPALSGADQWTIGHFNDVNPRLTWFIRDRIHGSVETCAGTALKKIKSCTVVCQYDWYIPVLSGEDLRANSRSPIPALAWGRTHDNHFPARR